MASRRTVWKRSVESGAEQVEPSGGPGPRRPASRRVPTTGVPSPASYSVRQTHPRRPRSPRSTRARISALDVRTILSPPPSPQATQPRRRRWPHLPKRASPPLPPRLVAASRTFRKDLSRPRPTLVPGASSNRAHSLPSPVRDEISPCRPASVSGGTRTAWSGRRRRTTTPSVYKYKMF
jgi:hypothetical protein